jgi:hypothetical protein
MSERVIKAGTTSIRLVIASPGISREDQERDH